jgi:glyoxylase-like metal-dependent hydrolase (beta-lactamase superfamily II)
MRVLRPAEGVFAFFDGRIEGYRFDERPNWVDEGALSLGVASYAVVCGGEAVVYDTHVSVEHASFIRGVLDGQGVRKFTVVLSHWHLDHVAGSAVFQDCEIIASEETAELLTRFKSAIERGEQEGPPPIDPLILPSSVFADRLRLSIGGVPVDLIHTRIHSDDAALLWLPERKLLFCGDAMEDPVTYVDEPENFTTHLANLAKLRQLAPEWILPNHGHPQTISDGGYSSDLIDATEDYIRTLQRCRTEPELRALSLQELMAGRLDGGSLHYFAPYEAVHRHNVNAVLAGLGSAPGE